MTLVPGGTTQFLPPEPEPEAQPSTVTLVAPYDFTGPDGKDYKKGDFFDVPAEKFRAQKDALADDGFIPGKFSKQERSEIAQAIESGDITESEVAGLLKQKQKQDFDRLQEKNRQEIIAQDPQSTAAAFGIGALRGGTLGASDYALEGLGVAEEGSLKQLAQDKPVATGAGELTGLLIPGTAAGKLTKQTFRTAKAMGAKSKLAARGTEAAAKGLRSAVKAVKSKKGIGSGIAAGMVLKDLLSGDD